MVGERERGEGERRGGGERERERDRERDREMMRRVRPRDSNQQTIKTERHPHRPYPHSTSMTSVSSSSSLHELFPSKDEHHRRALERRKRKAGKTVLIVRTSPSVEGNRCIVAGCNDGTIHAWDIARVLRRERAKEGVLVVGKNGAGRTSVRRRRRSRGSSFGSDGRIGDRSDRREENEKEDRAAGSQRTTDSTNNNDTTSAPSEDTYASDFKWRSENGSVYHMTFANDKESGKIYMLTACDRGVAMWDWNVLLERRKHVSPSKVFSIPRRATGSRGALGPIPECNKVVVSSDGRCMYVAAGDRKAYVYQHVFASGTTSASPVSLAGHSEYVHTVALASRYGHVYSGSEDGTVRVWQRGSCSDVEDVGGSKKRKRTKRRDPPPTYACVKVIQTTPSSSSRKSWVSAMDVDRDQNWLVVAGGVDHSSSVAYGQLLLVHLQTLAVIRRWQDVPGPLTSVHFTRTTKTVVTSGSDGTVCVWSCLGGKGEIDDATRNENRPRKEYERDLLRQFKARSSKSLNTAYIDETLGVLAVGGASPLVDIYPNGVKGGCCAFSLECADSGA